MRVMAFDIGIHHFAWSKVRSHPEPEIIAMDCFDIAGSHKHMKTTDLYPILLRYLRSLSYDNVGTVLIEQQMNRMNIRATKLAVFVYSFFLMEHPGITVLEFPAFHKTRVFGVHGLSKPERKKWSIRYVSEHVVQDDPVARDWLDQFPKKDDICDCVMMVLSFHKLVKTES
jgi:hypothetical protein